MAKKANLTQGDKHGAEFQARQHSAAASESQSVLVAGAASASACRGDPNGADVCGTTPRRGHSAGPPRSGGADLFECPCFQGKKMRRTRNAAPTNQR